MMTVCWEWDRTISVVLTDIAAGTACDGINRGGFWDLSWYERKIHDNEFHSQCTK